MSSSLPPTLLVHICSFLIRFLLKIFFLDSISLVNPSLRFATQTAAEASLTITLYTCLPLEFSVPRSKYDLKLMALCL